jgi:hypothetical protein
MIGPRASAGRVGILEEEDPMHHTSIGPSAARRILVAVLAVLALLALAPRGAEAQPITGTEPGIVAVGYGQATAPAASARLQFLIGPDQSAMMSGPPSSMTEVELEPIVQALVDAGLAEAEIEATMPSVAGGFFGPGAPENGEIRATVEQPTQDQLADLVQAVREAAGQAGSSVYHVGARFEADDCEAQVQAAREAAVADARARAEGLAAAVGATLGDLIQVSESPFFGPTGAGTCGEGLPPDIAGFGPFGPGTEPAFDPSLEAEAVAYVQVSLTFALGPAGEATPTA